jgi:serine/threonine protein kinase
VLLAGLALVHGVVLCDMDASASFRDQRYHGEKVGSGAYYAPEVARLKVKLVDSLETSPKLDVWSFGVLLFEMTTGRHLFPQVFLTHQN